MSKYWSMTEQRETTADDPERFIWYSSGCTYWTDDTDKIRSEYAPRVPTCPKCGAVGFQTEARKFLHPGTLAAFEAKPGNENYGAVFAWMKERCFASWLEARIVWKRRRKS